MSLMRPFSSIQSDLNRLFYEMERDLSLPTWSRRGEAGEALTSVWAPPIDVMETDQEIQVKASVPGFKPEEIDVEVDNNMLVIRGQTRKTEEDRQKNYHRREIVEGSFYRQIALPVEVDSDRADARFEHGMLMITVPKSPKSKKHKLQIK